MKAYSIGRDTNCDIVINDTTDVISRRHAILNVAPSGKMTIIDQSSNGTYVNGIRISPNIPVPVSRKDTVSLAHVAKLDWNQVPSPTSWIKWAAIAAGVLLVVAVSINKGGSCSSESRDIVLTSDSTKTTCAKDSVAKDSKDIKDTAADTTVAENDVPKKTKPTTYDKDKKKDKTTRKPNPSNPAGEETTKRQRIVGH